MNAGHPIDAFGVAETIEPLVSSVLTVTLSDGTSESVTQRATWESSDSSVATVNSSGQVAGLTSGDVEIREVFSESRFDPPDRRS